MYELIFINEKFPLFLDERVKDWPLMQSVLPTIFIVIVYILFVVFGQQWMKNKKAFELREFMFIYNFFQVIFCTYITYEVRQKRILSLFSNKLFLYT